MESKEMKEIEPQRQREVTGKRLGRVGKTFLAISMLSGIGTTPITSAEEENTSVGPNIEMRDSDTAITIAEKLRVGLKENGERRLTFEQAEKLIPKIAQLYTESIHTALDTNVLINNTYIVEDSITEEDRKFYNDNAVMMFAGGLTLDFESAPLFENLKRNYPELKIGENIKQSTISELYNTRLSTQYILSSSEIGKFFDIDFNSEKDVYGLTTNADKNAFVFLHASNNSDNPELISISDLECATSNPTEAFISTIFHEYLHFDAFNVSGEIEKNKLDGILMANVLTLFEDEAEIEGLYSGGFVIMAKTVKENDKKGLARFHNLDEFVVHYMTTKTLTENGIPTLMLNDRSPQAISNFDKILNQADINMTELKQMHSHSRVEDFFVRIAEKSDGVSFQTREEKVKFGFDLFVPLMKSEKDWQRGFANYYEIDLADYSEKPFSDGLVYKGCGVPLTSEESLASVR